MKKVLLIFLPLLSTVLVSWGTFKVFEKDIESFVLGQIEVLTNENLPVKIKAKSFELQFLPPSISLSQITLVPKNPAQFGFDQLSVERVKGSLDFIQALAGQIYLSSLIIDRPQLSLDIDRLEKSGGSDEIDWQSLFQILGKTPLLRLIINQSEIKITSAKPKMAVALTDLDVMVVNQKNKLAVSADLSSGSLQISDLATIPLSARVDLVIKPDQIEFQESEVRLASSFLKAEGTLTETKNLLKNPQGKVKFQSSIRLEELNKYLDSLSPRPNLAGTLALLGEGELGSGNHHHSHFSLKGKELGLSGFKIGDIDMTGDIRDNRIRLSDLILNHPSGDLFIKNLEAQLDGLKSINLKAHVESDQVDIHELLLQIGVGDIPLEAFLSGKFDCEGPIIPRPDIQCRGSAKSEQLEILSEGSSVGNTIAAVDDFAADGELRITNEAVSYKAQVAAKEDHGSSEGIIDYKTGFKINFSTPELHFKNVRNLANLKLEGSGKIQGETKGDSAHGVFSMSLDLNEVFFEDYYLGFPKGSLNYKAGQLSFENINGTLRKSKYSAGVTVDLKKSMIKAEAQALTLELADLVEAVKRKAEMPVDISGLGSAFIKLEGPLQFNQLSYNLSAQAFRGSIAGESYDRLQADISAVNGEVKADKILLAKNKSIISVFGNGHPNGQIELSIRGDQFLLEESENISKLSSAISGLFNFQVELTGHVLSPDLNFKGSLSNLIIEEQEFPGSTLAFILNKSELEGSANLLGNRLKSEYRFPLSDKGRFRLKAKADDWNFATLGALIGGASLLNDYQTSLTGTIDLASEMGGFFKSTGQVRIDRFLLQRGPLSLVNKGQMELNMKEGIASLSNFKIFGENGFVEIKGNQFTAEDLRFSIDGNSNLRLFHIFVPFMEELGGNGKISATVSGPLIRPQILGSGKITNGFAKLKGFPHSFERVNSEIQFSASKILINQFSGNLAGGTFEGDGQIAIEGPKNLPTNIVAKLENGSFNVPEGIHTNGDAEVSFTGSWFPFLLSGTYHVKSGLIDKEFGDEASMNSIKQSSYLPKVILQGAFEPVILDIQAIIDKPLAVKNSMSDGHITGQIQIKGPPTQPSLLGNITMDRNSKLTVRDQEFTVSSGSVQFKDPSEINPEFYIAARSRITDYDVSLLVQGNAKAPQVRLSSTPPLSEADLASLLALGVVTSKSDQRIKNQNAIDSQTAMAAALSGLLSNGTAKKTQEMIGVNVQLSSTYDDTKNVAVQKITLIKKLTDKLNVSASRVQGLQNSNELKLRYNLSNSLSTVGTYEERQPIDDGKGADSSRKGENILGLDLEYKLEFK